MNILLFYLISLVTNSTLCMEEEYLVTQPLLLSDEQHIEINHTPYSNTNDKEIFLDRMKNILPQEIWWHISTFLEGNDTSLEFILSLIDLNSKQALTLLQRYIAYTQEKPLPFFTTFNTPENFKILQGSWSGIQKLLHRGEQVLLSNTTQIIIDYINQEIIDSKQINGTYTILENGDCKTFREKIYYSLYCIEHFQHFSQEHNRKTICLNNIRFTKSRLALVSLGIMTILGCYLMLSNNIIISENKAAITNYEKQKAQEMFNAFLKCDIFCTKNPDTIYCKEATCIYQYQLDQASYNSTRAHEHCVKANSFKVVEIAIDIALIKALLLVVPLGLIVWKCLFFERTLIDEKINTLLADYRTTLLAQLGTAQEIY
jgi:hypothetical protein